MAHLCTTTALSPLVCVQIELCYLKILNELDAFGARAFIASSLVRFAFAYVSLPLSAIAIAIAIASRLRRRGRGRGRSRRRRRLRRGLSTSEATRRVAT